MPIVAATQTRFCSTVLLDAALYRSRPWSAPSRMRPLRSCHVCPGVLGCGFVRS